MLCQRKAFNKVAALLILREKVFDDPWDRIFGTKSTTGLGYAVDDAYIIESVSP